MRAISRVFNGRHAFATIDLGTAALLYLAVFEGLPTRYALVDVPAALLIVLALTTAAALFTDSRWARVLSRLTAYATLVLGLVFIAAVAMSASYLFAIYGPVGRGGALIAVLCAALAVPYLVVLPAAQLIWSSTASVE